MTTERPGPQFIAMAPLDRSALTGLYTSDVTQYLRITKLAIKQYLEECLRPTGQFRSFFDKIATYTVGYHVNHYVDKDPNETYLQIAVFSDNVCEAPPQIFIQDAGYEYAPASLGSLTAGWNMNTKQGSQVVRVMDVINVPIEITCITTSQQEVEDLTSIMSAAFGQLCRFTVNYILRQAPDVEGSFWEVRLPLTHSISTKSHTPIHGDPRHQFWSAACNMTVEFENSIMLQYKSQPLAVYGPGSVQLSVPSTLKLQQQHRISLLQYPRPIQVYSNDPKVAIVRQRGYEWIIEPRRVGTFTLMVTRIHGTERVGPKVLAEQEIKIVAR